MANYIYLGYGVTDNNGKAKLEYDAQGNSLTHSYTGTGAGEVDIVASLDNTITNTSPISEAYSIIDGTFKDIAITGEKNTNWTNPGSAVNVETDEIGTTLSNTSGTFHIWANNYSQFTGPFAVEMDILSYHDSGNGGFRISGTNTNFVFKNYNVPQSCHLKLMFIDGEIKYQIDGGVVTTYANNVTDTSAYVGFRFVGEWNVKYKNFVVYPI